MNHAGETKLLQANWRITLEIPDCLRQIDVLHCKCEKASGKLIFPAWFFNLPEAFCSRRWNHSFASGNWMQTKWFFCQPEAFSRITYWKDIYFEAMKRRRLDSSFCLRFFYITYWKDTFLKAMKRRRVDLSVSLTWVRRKKKSKKRRESRESSYL